LGLLALSCGGPPRPPRRGVIEGDVSSWSFRRYQAVLDIEVWVPENRAAAHTASYVRKDAEKQGRLTERDVVNAFVTRYKDDAGILRALIKFVRRLAQESGYAVEEKEIAGTQLILVTGSGESWAMWAARRHVVKIGGRGIDRIPKSVIEAYAERYPSRLESGALDGPLPPGPDEQPEDEPPFDSTNPRPDWQD
jgi:hypothetical protein